jgi:hypothetical protein
MVPAGSSVGKVPVIDCCGLRLADDGEGVRSAIPNETCATHRGTVRETIGEEKKGCCRGNW